MSVGQGRPDEGPSAPRMLTSVPWIVVMLGVGLLVSLLIFALLSLRQAERPVPAALDPPIYLPTIGAQTPTSAPPSGAPLLPIDDTPSPTATSPTPTPSAKASSAASSASTLAAPAAPLTGTVTARYQATASNRDWFEARLTVTNGSGRSQSWEVELLFAGNVKSIKASSSSGLSVSTQGSGAFVLRGTGPLPSGESAVVSMRFTRTGTGDQPGQCTVNGANCVIG
ncbi:cellulose binding domain-containing protein [Micromonospora sp. MS34]|uniref:cellulose binding domain-containing protein n=1 Tax=Micromonospora sp. MS34 TaxID=3385971 RepID=UPI0039A277F6